MANYFARVPAVFIDGLIYVLLNIVTAWMTIISSDSARTFIGPFWIFWISSFLATTNAGLLALRMFRSTAFAEHQKDKKEAAGFQTAYLQKLAQGKENDIKTF